MAVNGRYVQIDCEFVFLVRNETSKHCTNTILYIFRI